MLGGRKDQLSKNLMPFSPCQIKRTHLFNQLTREAGPINSLYPSYLLLEMVGTDGRWILYKYNSMESCSWLIMGPERSETFWFCGWSSRGSACSAGPACVSLGCCCCSASSPLYHPIPQTLVSILLPATRTSALAPHDPLQAQLCKQRRSKGS